MRTSSRLPMLLFSVLILACTFFVSTPHRSEAVTCPYGWYPGTLTTYYSDASYTTAVCSESDCTGTYCENPTPYYRTRNTCCNGN
jgi:hypothetical protein